MKRSGPPQRKAPLARSGIVRPRRSPLAAVSPRALLRRERGAQARSKVILRARGICEAQFALDCTGKIDHLHHRKLRSQGGRDTIHNLCATCWPCHSAIHAYPALAYSTGHLVHGSEDPAQIPLRRPNA